MSVAVDRDGGICGGETPAGPSVGRTAAVRRSGERKRRGGGCGRKDAAAAAACAFALCVSVTCVFVRVRARESVARPPDDRDTATITSHGCLVPT